MVHIMQERNEKYLPCCTLVEKVALTRIYINLVSTYPIIIAAVCQRSKAESTRPANDLPKIEYKVEKID